MESRALGVRTFARLLKKRDAGLYVRVVFSLEPDSVTPLLARYKLNEDVFRVQIVRDEARQGGLESKVKEVESNGES